MVLVFKRPMASQGAYLTLSSLACAGDSGKLNVPLNRSHASILNALLLELPNLDNV